jgi:hypothetical protein
MMIMAKQATNKVSIIKLPDGQCTQTGRETVKELFRVHFCESVQTDDSNDEWGQHILDACRSRMNRECGTWQSI